MSEIKRWMHSIYDDCFEIGVSATAQKYNIPEREVKQVTMNWDGFEGPWEDYIESATWNVEIAIQKQK